MPCEIYALNYDGDRLRFEDCAETRRKADLLRWAEEGALTPPCPRGVLHCALGDEALLCCQVYRDADAPMAFFVLRDALGVLMVAVTRGHLAYIQALAHFSRAVTYARYAGDIFEHPDDGDDD